MRKFFVILLTFTVFEIAYAISADDIIKDFKKRYASAKSFGADFEQTTLISGRKSVASGKVNFQKPNLLRQEYFDPAKPANMTQIIISDGKVLWSYTPLVNQVTKQSIPQGKEYAELLPGFGVSMENVEKNYTLKLVKDELAEKNGIHVLELIPKGMGSEEGYMFDELQVWVRDVDSVPVQFMYKNKRNEMTFIMTFKNVKINEKLAASIFKFDVPKGAQVIAVPNK